MKPDASKIDQPEEKRKSKVKRKKHLLQNYTYPHANMQVRVMTQLLIEDLNAWTSVDIHKA